MPYLTCPKCKYEQLVPTEMMGLEVDCEKCGKEYTARERRSFASAVPIASDMPDVDTATIAKTAGFVLLLLITVAGVWWFIVTMIDRAKKPPEETPPAPRIVDRQDMRQRPGQWPIRDENPAPQFMEPQDPKSIRRYAVGGIVSVIAVVYCGAVLIGSFWIARTSSERGQPAVSWLIYYWFTQVFLRGVPYGAYHIIEAAGAYGITAAMGLVAFIAGELFGWSGLIAYRMAGYRKP